MQLLGATDDRGPAGRSQDDAAVGYGFQRHPNEPEFPQFTHKQHRWATGDDAIIDVRINLFFFLNVFSSLHTHIHMHSVVFQVFVFVD